MTPKVCSVEHAARAAALKGVKKIMTIELVNHNPAMKKPAACILGLFASELVRQRADVEAEAAAVWQEAYCQPVGTMVDVLVRNHALIEEVLVDGEPYEGTLEDLQMDENVPLDAEFEDRLTLTKAGHDLAESIDPNFTMKELINERPHYKAIYTRVLNLCAADEGASREAVEAAVEQDGRVNNPEGKRVYPQYFMDALESAGGIEWHGAWKTTAAGKKVLLSA